MKVIPIQGLKIINNITVVVKVFNDKMLEKILGIKNPKGVSHIYIDDITFVNRKNLKSKIVDEQEIENILNKFTGTETFAIMETRFNRYSEFYNLKLALSIIYLAYRKHNEIPNGLNNEFGLGVKYGYYTGNGIESTRWSIAIGIKKIDENNYDLTIPTYYTLDEELESWELPKYESNELNIKTDISTEINKISGAIVKINEMANKLKSALYLLYNTLNFNNKDLVIIMYSTILETLLLSSNESNQRKKVSVRLACLLRDMGNIKEKEYIANWIYYFYKYRNAIVHDGKSFIELEQEDISIFNHALSLIQHYIFILLDTIIDNDIKSIEDIINIVKKNIINDKLKNGFDYITNDRIMFYEE